MFAVTFQQKLSKFKLLNAQKVMHVAVFYFDFVILFMRINRDMPSAESVHLGSQLKSKSLVLNA